MIYFSLSIRLTIAITWTTLGSWSNSGHIVLWHLQFKVPLRHIRCPTFSILNVTWDCFEISFCLAICFCFLWFGLLFKLFLSGFFSSLFLCFFIIEMFSSVLGGISSFWVLCFCFSKSYFFFDNSFFILIILFFHYFFKFFLICLLIITGSFLWSAWFLNKPSFFIYCFGNNILLFIQWFNFRFGFFKFILSFFYFGFFSGIPFFCRVIFNNILCLI